MTSTSAVRSARGTRPRNRRDQIRNAAAVLFYERGYEQVSIADVAESVNVGPSALYRHFSSKADLLYAAIDQMIDAFAAGIADLPAHDLPGIARTAARTALAHRPLGVLWQREARNLPAEQRDVLRRHLRAAIAALAGTLQEVRPELDNRQAEFLASAGVSAMSSISFHRIALPAAEFETVLAELGERVLGYTFPADRPPEPTPVPPAAPTHRRDQIADAAAILFARHGFDAVSIDDIGAAVGIAGPSIYNHFTSKQDVLFASMAHGYTVLAEALSDALDEASDGERGPAAVLRRVSDSYVDLTCDQSDLVSNLIAESRHLGPEYADLARRAQRSYLARWSGLVTRLRPEEDPLVSRLKVQTAQMMANSIVRTAYLRDRPGFRSDLAEICWLLQQ